MPSVSPESSTAATPLTQAVTSGDGARFELLLLQPAGPVRHVLYWLPALGVPARHYLPLATELTRYGVAVALHEWRGIGSSDRRASRGHDWGYRHLIGQDLPAGLAAAGAHWPRQTCLIGGHSLGGQLAALQASLIPGAFAGLVLVASGLPYWRCFDRSWLVGLSYVLAPSLADLFGYLPGRRIGFGGNEARGVIRDWARSGRHGRYAADGMQVDFERQLGQLTMPVCAIRASDDWLVPAASLEGLLAKMPGSPVDVSVLDATALGTRADHFAWMRAPQAVAGGVARWLDRRNAVFAGAP